MRLDADHEGRREDERYDRTSLSSQILSQQEKASHDGGSQYWRSHSDKQHVCPYDSQGHPYVQRALPAED